MVAERTGPHSPVKLSGSVPPLAEFFHQRPETGLDLRVGLYPGDTVVLTHGEETASAPAAQGGTGKTQIAVAFSHALWGARAVDALVWVPATSREAIVTGFAQAARTVGAADHALPAEAAAGRFTGWLAHTRRPWALILDDLVSPADLEGLWPAGPGGQVVITTGLPGGRLPGRTADRAGRRVQPPRGAGVPERPAHRLSRPAGRGPRPGRGPGRAAARAGPGRRGDDPEPAELPGVPGPARRAARAHGRDPGGRRLPRRAGHLVAGGGVRARAAARGRGLAGARAGRHARPARHPRRGADQPGRVQLRGRPAEHRGRWRTRPWSARP